MAEFDDIFEEMRKMMRTPFKGFFDDDLFADMGEDLEESESEKDEKAKKASKDAKESKFAQAMRKFRKTGKPEQKAYSISYKFGTGMKEPEIPVEGDIDEKTVNQFLEGVSHQFGFDAIGSMDPTKLLKPNAVSSDDAEDEAEGYSVPFTDIQDGENGNTATAILEMPGIGKEHIKLEMKDHKVILTAVNGDIKYRKVMRLGFTPAKDPEMSANNGIIQIRFTKA